MGRGEEEFLPFFVLKQLIVRIFSSLPGVSPFG
jgi:hypothetical protein